jgi:hypothetical protein
VKEDSGIESSHHSDHQIIQGRISRVSISAEINYSRNEGEKTSSKKYRHEVYLTVADYII